MSRPLVETGVIPACARPVVGELVNVALVVG
jgi:hypothetical protein